MCVPIFLRGQKRLAAPDTRWLFHAPRSVDYFSGKDIKTPRFEQRYYAHEYFDTYFRDSPIDKGWLARNAPKWQGRDFWRTGRAALRGKVQHHHRSDVNRRSPDGAKRNPGYAC